ncbi:MAG: 6-bladed beta-propeller [Candidatus Delongbacteria bacterium]|nr:6-bladed beta-propeller [Candidatus Delongbacteria bacterium]
MKIIKYLVILSAVLLAVGCTKKETDIPQKTVKLTKLYTIEGYPEGADTTRTFTLTWNATKVDNEGNVFIRDEKSGSIRVFDKNGKFKNNISITGMGPEEIEFFNTFYFENDTLCILDNLIKIKKFLKNGAYISTKIIEFDEITRPQEIYELNDSTLIMEMTTFKREESSLLWGQILSIVNKDMKTKKIIYKSYLDYPKEGKQILFKKPIFAYNDSSIFGVNGQKVGAKIVVTH